jgi:hypothetical protein
MPDLVQVTSPSGVKFTVAKEAADAFTGLLADLEGQGYKIDQGQSGGYSNRNIANTNTPSQHSFGRAVDINWHWNERGANTDSDMPPNIGDLAAKRGLTWGGTWKGGDRDPMHFEFSPGGVKPVAASQPSASWDSLGVQARPNAAATPAAPAARPGGQQPAAEPSTPVQDPDTAWGSLGAKSGGGGDTTTTTAAKAPEPQSMLGTVGSSLVRGVHEEIDPAAEVLARGFDYGARLFGYDTKEGDKTAALSEAAKKEYEANPQNQGLVPAVARLVGNLAATLGPARIAGAVGSGLAARGVGEVATRVGAAAEPWVRNALRYVPSLAGGAAGGAEVSAQTGQPIKEGAALGGALGVAMPIAGEAANALFATRNPAVVSAVQEHGIPLRAGQVSDNRMVRYLDDMTAPARSNAAQRTAVTVDAARSMGITPEVAAANNLPAGQITPATMAFARGMNGGMMGAVESRTTLQPTRDIATRLTAIRDAVARTPSIQADVETHLRDIAEAAAANRGVIPGDVYRVLNGHGSALDVASNQPGPAQHYINQIREVLRDAMETSATPADRELYRQARLQYKNMMTLAPLVNKGVPGEISPLLLQGAANRSFGNNAFRGAGDLGELGDVAQQFLRAPPQSGTEPREAIRAGLGGLYGDIKSLTKLLGANTVGRLMQAGYLGRNPVQPFNPVPAGDIGYALPATVDIRNQVQGPGTNPLLR